MANIYDQIDWIVPGESVKSSVANRPLKKLVDMLDNNQNPSLSSVQGTNIDVTLVDVGVSSGDFVYYDSTAGVFKQALGGTNDKVQGCYILDENSNYTLIFGGLLDIGTYVKDETYYLSNTTAGTLTNVWYEGAVEIGVAISTTQLLMSSLDENQSFLISELDTKANLYSPTFTGTVSGITKAMVGLGFADNTSDVNKPISTAQQTALDLKEDETNKVTAFQLTPDDNHYPSEKLVKDSLDNKIDDIVVLDLAYTIPTIEAMLLVDSNKHTTVIVNQNTDQRGGTFVYDATQSAINDGGTIFNGWVRQYSGVLNPMWFGAKPYDNTFDNATILQSIITLYDELDLHGNHYYSTTISTAGKTIKNGGLLSFNGTTTLLTFDASGTKLVDLNMVGWKLNDETLASNTCINANSDGFSIVRCSISNFSYFGINITSAGSSESPSFIIDCEIFLNGSGINTGDGEYINISNNKIYRNGWKNDRSDRSPIFAGTDSGWGIIGKFSNTSIANNHILENVIGCALEAGGGSNPDHNMLSNNTINHNGTVGLILNGFTNNEQIVGNIILSNVIKPYAAGTVWSPIGSACDVAIIDCVNMQFSNNTLGGGTLGQVPVFGHASCVYTNNIMYSPFVETRVPSASAPIVTMYGYIVNSNNIFKNNIYRGFTQHTFLPTTVNIKSADNTENGVVVDGVIQSLTLASGWIFPAGAADPDTQPLECWREGGNKVTVSGAVVLDGGGAIALTLPSGYRPSGDISVPCVSNGTIQYVKIYKSGDVQPVGATSGLPFNINVTYRI